MIELDTVIRSCYDLDPLGPSAARLSAVAFREDVDFDEVVEIVTYDPALTARLLRVANSVASSSGLPITTVKDALLRTGTSTAVQLAMGSAVRGPLSQSVGAYSISEEGLWRHSVAAAIATNLAGKFCSIRLPKESFTAALLHDIGKLVLGRYLTPSVLDIVRRANEDAGLPEFMAESEILHVHHGEVGGLVAQHWNLPQNIVWGITYHHDPEKFEFEGDDTICYVVYLANLVANAAGATSQSGETADVEGAGAAGSRLGITPDGFKELCDQVACEFEIAIKLYR